MKLEINDHENYAAKFVTLHEFEEIPNASNLKHAIINGNRVIVSKSAEAGTRGIFFPVESQISKEFVARNNLFSDKTLNFDQEKVGFFGEKGRVRAVKLRGAVSEGFFCPLDHIEKWKGIPESEWDKVKENTSFDTINGIELCKKYVIHEPQVNTPRVGRKVKKQPSRMIEGSYKLHYDTPKFLDNCHLLSPEDYIYIDNKLHGSSISMGRVLVKRQLSIWEKIKKFFGLNVVTTEFANIYASRSVIKNGTPNQVNNHYYDENIWEVCFNKVQHVLEDNQQIYGELVGFTPSGGAIQKLYDYSCKQGEQEFYVYRITSKDERGEIKEWGMDEIVEFCNKHQIKHVPIFYKGLAKDLFPDLSVSEHWHHEFAKKLRNSFNMEKRCELCRNDVPAEGVTLKIQGRNLPAYKFKSFRFLQKESKDLDEGVVDIESAESIKTEENE
jgi:hypothetical protein